MKKLKWLTCIFFLISMMASTAPIFSQDAGAEEPEKKNKKGKKKKAEGAEEKPKKEKGGRKKKGEAKGKKGPYKELNLTADQEDKIKEIEKSYADTVKDINAKRKELAARNSGKPGTGSPGATLLTATGRPSIPWPRNRRRWNI